MEAGLRCSSGKRIRVGSVRFQLSKKQMSAQTQRPGRIKGSDIFLKIRMKEFVSSDAALTRSGSTDEIKTDMNIVAIGEKA